MVLSNLETTGLLTKVICLLTLDDSVKIYTLYFNKCSNIFERETWTDNKVDVKIHMHSLTVFLLTMIINSKSRLKRTMVYVPVCMDSSKCKFST